MELFIFYLPSEGTTNFPDFLSTSNWLDLKLFHSFHCINRSIINDVSIWKCKYSKNTTTNEIALLIRTTFAEFLLLKPINVINTQVVLLCRCYSWINYRIGLAECLEFYLLYYVKVLFCNHSSKVVLLPTYLIGCIILYYLTVLCNLGNGIIGATRAT